MAIGGLRAQSLRLAAWELYFSQLLEHAFFQATSAIIEFRLSLSDLLLVPLLLRKPVVRSIFSQLRSDALFRQLRAESLSSQLEGIPELGDISAALDGSQLFGSKIDWCAPFVPET